MAEARNHRQTRPEPNEAETSTGMPDADAAGGDRSQHSDIEAELTDARDKLLRALAEQQNIRRQMQRERDEAVKYAASRLAEDLLDTLDNLQRAIESVPPESAENAVVERLLSGVAATERNLLSTLARHGIRKIAPVGEAFDPHRHHAMMQRPASEAEEGTVLQVLQPGYMLHDRLLRPALVEVASRA